MGSIPITHHPINFYQKVIMQTFLPYADFEKSASVLDRMRLGKQRVETLQIAKALVFGVGWIHHPAVKMWAGFETALLAYQKAVCNEWTSRGYKDTCLDKTTELLLDYSNTVVFPDWFNNDNFHASHRSNLLRKDPVYYGQFGWEEPDDLPYVWGM